LFLKGFSYCAKKQFEGYFYYISAEFNAGIRVLQWYWML